MSHRRADPVVVVGGGIAGFSAAFALRELDYDGPLILVSDEPALPYRRSPLAGAYLRGDVGPQELLLAPADAYRRAGIDLLLGARATRLEPTRRAVTIRGHGSIRYHRAVIATGSVPENGLPGPDPYRLDTRADADGLRAAVPNAGRAVVVGLGDVGTAAAASLRALGLDVVAVDAREAPTRVVDELDHDRLDRLTRDGVDIRLGTHVVAVEGSARAEAIRTASGQRIEGDLIVTTIGSKPVRMLLSDTPSAAEPQEAVRPAGPLDPYVFVVGDAARPEGAGRTAELAAAETAAVTAAALLGRSGSSG